MSVVDKFGMTDIASQRVKSCSKKVIVDSGVGRFVLDNKLMKVWTLFDLRWRFVLVDGIKEFGGHFGRGISGIIFFDLNSFVFTARAKDLVIKLPAIKHEYFFKQLDYSKAFHINLYVSILLEHILHLSHEKVKKS